MKKFLDAMREDLVGLDVDYCFHLRTLPKARRQFTIVMVDIDEHDNIILLGEDRMVLLGGMLAIGHIRDGEKWTKEGIIYQHRGEELKIGGRSWTTWFQTCPRVYLPV